MNADFLVSMFTKVGFPIGLCIWLIYRLDQLIVAWTASQVELAKTQVTMTILLEQLIQMHK